MTKRNLEAKAWAGHDSVMLRGGRLVKRKGQVLSFAPHVGQLSSVSCGALATSFVLGAALFGATPAIAGTCDPLTPTPNPDGSAVTCSAPADDAIDETQVIVGQQLTVTTAPGFGISTSAGDGLNFNVASGYNSGLTFVDTNESQITAAETALSGNAVGTTTITSNGALDGGTYGIKFAVASVGSLTIDSTGSVNGETEDGINASISGEARNITVRAATVAGGDDGINVVNNAYGNTLIESSLSVIAAPGGGVGVVAVNRGRLSENLTVNVADVTGNAGGIEVSNLGTGATVVTSSVRVFTENGDGISANNDGFYNPITQSFDIFTTDMTVTTNIVEAANNGIIAINSGNGSTSISSSSYVSGNSGDGIGATNGPNAQNLTIHAAAVDGGDDGLVAVNEGYVVT